MKLTRLCDVPEGSIVMAWGMIYQVRREGKIKLTYPGTQKEIYGFGLRCQMWVEVIEEF